MPGLKLLATLATIAIGLAALEWWSVNELYGADKFAGPLMGVAIVAFLALFPYLFRRFNEPWQGAVVAALRAVIELLFCVVVFSSVSAFAVRILPFSISASFLRGDSAADFLIYLMLLLGLVVAARGWHKYKTESLVAANAQLEAARARSATVEKERELVKAELAVLRAQIEPHFLWNTLAHIQFLTRKRPEDAEVMTGHLIKFLRSAVPQTNDGASTLGSELESVDAYLNLMKIRMGDRLSIAVESDSIITTTPFPPRIIHTLVENAIKHGIEPKVGPVSISVTAKLSQPDGRHVVIDVIDNGIGLADGPSTKGTGLGLPSIRERLRLFYGEDAQLSIVSGLEAGIIARVKIPYLKSSDQ